MEEMKIISASLILCQINRVTSLPVCGCHVNHHSPSFHVPLSPSFPVHLHQLVAHGVGVLIGRFPSSPRDTSRAGQSEELCGENS